MIHVRLRISRTFEFPQERSTADEDDHYDLLTRAFENRAQKRAKVRQQKTRLPAQIQVISRKIICSAHY